MAVNTDQRGEVLIFRLSGRIIGSGVGELRKEIDKQLANISQSPKLLFDFADVIYRIYYKG